MTAHGNVPLYSVRSIGAPLDVAPGASGTHSSRLWVGPKLQKPMSDLSPSLKLSVDYGLLSFIAQPLFWLLSWLHLALGNWAWAIIAIVVLLKAALYPLSAKQYQSFAKMRAIQPSTLSLVGLPWRFSPLIWIASCRSTSPCSPGMDRQPYS